MKRPLRVSIVVLVLALIAVGVVAAFWALWRNAPAVAVFPDGSRLKFVGSAVGTQTFTTERPWHKLARRILPNRWQSWIPAALSGSCGSSTNSVTFFFRQTNKAAGPPLWMRYYAEDASGFHYPTEGGYCSFGGGSGATLIGLKLQNYPRRDRTLNLVLLAVNSREVVRLRLPNPVHGPFPEWKPEALPLTRTNGSVTLTLDALTWRTNRSWSPLDPAWRISTREPAWAHAQPGWIEVEDATGNAGAYAALSEPAWRLKIAVRRERWEDFSASEVLVLTNLSLPPAGEFKAVDVSAQLSGCTVTLGAICGAGQLSITNGTMRGMTPPTGEYLGQGMMSTSSLTVEYWGSNRPFLFLEIAGMYPHDGVLWRAFDAQGRDLKLAGAGHFVSRGAQHRVYQPEFATATNAVISRLEIAVSRALEFEFCLDPRTAVTQAP